MRGLGFTTGYFPDKYFANEYDEPETHYFEAKSIRFQRRPERVLWLGEHIAALEVGWLGYAGAGGGGEGSTFFVGKKAKECFDDNAAETGGGSGSGSETEEGDSDRASKARGSESRRGTTRGRRRDRDEEEEYEDEDEGDEDENDADGEKGHTSVPLRQIVTTPAWRLVVYSIIPYDRGSYGRSRMITYMVRPCAG
jgi:hypothetical protein